MTTAPQLAALHDETIDIGLLREPPADEPGLGFRTVLEEPFVAVLPTGHALTTHRTVRLGDLADEPFVLLPRAVGPLLHDQNPQLLATVSPAQAGTRPSRPGPSGRS